MESLTCGLKYTSLFIILYHRPPTAQCPLKLLSYEATKSQNYKGAQNMHKEMENLKMKLKTQEEIEIPKSVTIY